MDIIDILLVLALFIIICNTMNKYISYNISLYDSIDGFNRYK